MDPQQANQQPQYAPPQPLNNPAPQAAPFATAPSPPPRPDISSIYPTVAPPTPQNNTYATTQSQFDPTSMARRQLGGRSSLALITAIIAVAILPTVIFFPSIINSTVTFILLLLAMFSSSGLSIYLATKDIRNQVNADSAILATSLAAVILVIAVVLSAYYFKFQLLINSFTRF